jgi:hypothetical protein
VFLLLITLCITEPLLAGEKSDLATLRRNLSNEEYEELKEAMSDEVDGIMQQLADHRGLKHRGFLATNKAVAMDAMQTAARIGS